MKNKFISLVVMSLFVSKGVLAQPQQKSFEDVAIQFSVSCVKDDCDKPFSKTVIEPDGRMKSYFRIIAKKQAQIWGDTILEGDYIAAGDTRLDQVRELRINDKPVGYLITYSEKAWNISDCAYDGLHPDTLNECVSGRIVESSYVSPDLSKYFYDDTTCATFK